MELLGLHWTSWLLIAAALPVVILVKVRVLGAWEHKRRDKRMNRREEEK